GCGGSRASDSDFGHAGINDRPIQSAAARRSSGGMVLAQRVRSPGICGMYRDHFRRIWPLRIDHRHLARAFAVAFSAIKFPLLIFVTCGANGLLNGMLAQVLGSGLSFKQTT